MVGVCCVLWDVWWLLCCMAYAVYGVRCMLFVVCSVVCDSWSVLCDVCV